MTVDELLAEAPPAARGGDWTAAHTPTSGPR